MFGPYLSWVRVHWDLRQWGPKGWTHWMSQPTTIKKLTIKHAHLRLKAVRPEGLDTLGVLNDNNQAWTTYIVTLAWGWYGSNIWCLIYYIGYMIYVIWYMTTYGVANFLYWLSISRYYEWTMNAILVQCEWYMCDICVIHDRYISYTKGIQYMYKRYTAYMQHIYNRYKCDIQVIYKIYE